MHCGCDTLSMHCGCDTLSMHCGCDTLSMHCGCDTLSMHCGCDTLSMHVEEFESAPDMMGRDVAVRVSDIRQLANHQAIDTLSDRFDETVFCRGIGTPSAHVEAFEWVQKDATNEPITRKTMDGILSNRLKKNLKEKPAVDMFRSGWRMERYCRKENRFYYLFISPMKEIKFRSLKSATEFYQSLTLEFHGDEWKAYEQFLGNVEGSGKNINNYVYSSGKRLGSVVVNPGKIDGFFHMKDNAKKGGGSVARKRASKAKITLPAGDMKWAPATNNFSTGWKTKTYFSRNGGRSNPNKRYVSPIKNITFRLLHEAKDFDQLLVACAGDEDEALQKFESNRIHFGKRKHYSISRVGKTSSTSDNDGGGKRPCSSPKRPKGKAKPINKAAMAKAGKKKTKVLKEKEKERWKKRKGEAIRKRNQTATTPRSKSTGHIPSSRLQASTAPSGNMMDCPFRTSASTAIDNGLNCDEIKITRLKPSKKTSFFSEHFKGRTLRVVSSLSDDPPEKVVTHNDTKYTLASAKLIKDKQGGTFTKEKLIELVYIRAKNLHKELEKICSFSLMRPEKVVARLAHLQSEAHSILYVDRSKVKLIKEDGHEGCGFYPEGFFDSLSKTIDAIQVRMVGPKLGLAKGMLIKKRGITHIELPSSMLKAPKSSHDEQRWVAVVIKNSFPSQENVQMERMLDPDAAHPTKSWKEKDKKQLSPMYERMLIGFGVSKSLVKSYTIRSRQPMKLKHAHMKGSVDPTGGLPEGKVFITGHSTSNNNRKLFGKIYKKVYLSRSPSLEPTDAKLVSVIGSKPKDMSKADWDLLCGYKFGTIIFPRLGSKLSTPLSSMIAGGDLDGDDYFVLWDGAILKNLLLGKDKVTKKSRKLLHKLELPEGSTHVNKKTKFSKHPDTKWLSKAQNIML